MGHPNRSEEQIAAARGIIITGPNCLKKINKIKIIQKEYKFLKLNNLEIECENRKEHSITIRWTPSRTNDT